jgi:hypothetical protein
LPRIRHFYRQYLRAYWQPKILWAFGGQNPFQDYGIVATCGDPTANTSLLPVAQATVEDSCHRASAGGARRHRPNTLAARTARWLELLIYGYTETDLLTY